MNVIWDLKSFDELSKLELYEVLRLRHEVFVVEQKCYYQDLDYNDMKSYHLIGRIEDTIIAYTRIFPLKILFDKYVSFGRVLVAESHRKVGVGHLMLKEILHIIESKMGNCPIKISAQTYLLSFYESHGFRVEGEEFMDAGVPHIYMVRESKRC